MPPPSSVPAPASSPVGPSWADERAPAALEAELAGLVQPGALEQHAQVWFGVTGGSLHHLLDAAGGPRCGAPTPVTRRRAPVWSSELLRRKLCPTCLAGAPGLVHLAEQVAVLRSTATAYLEGATCVFESLALARRWAALAASGAPSTSAGPAGAAPGVPVALGELLARPGARWLAARAATLHADGLAALAADRTTWEHAALRDVAARVVPTFGQDTLADDPVWGGCGRGGLAGLAGAFAAHPGDVAGALAAYRPTARVGLGVAELPGEPCCAYPGGGLAAWLAREWEHAAGRAATAALTRWTAELATVLAVGARFLVHVEGEPVLYAPLAPIAAVWPPDEQRWTVPLVAGLYAEQSWRCTLTAADAGTAVFLQLLAWSGRDVQGLPALLATAAATIAAPTVAAPR